MSRRVARLGSSSILEVGCGEGAVGARLAALATTRSYLGVEPDARSAAVAADRIGRHGGTVRVCGDDDLEPGRQFDLVCAFEVLEHLEDDEAALARWAARVRDGGSLLLSVPAWPSRFGPMDEHAGHFRRYEPPRLAAMLSASGLEVNEVVVYGWPLGFALEAVRNRVDAHRRSEDLTKAQLTAATGRTFQVRRQGIGLLVATGVAPFRFLQRIQPGRGIGLVAVASRK